MPETRLNRARGVTISFRSAKRTFSLMVFHVLDALKGHKALHSSRNPVSIANDRPLERQVDAEDSPKARTARPPTAPEAGGVAGRPDLRPGRRGRHRGGTG